MIHKELHRPGLERDEGGGRDREHGDKDETRTLALKVLKQSAVSVHLRFNGLAQSPERQQRDVRRTPWHGQTDQGAPWPNHSVSTR
jgi:hypothetical protein